MVLIEESWAGSILTIPHLVVVHVEDRRCCPMYYIRPEKDRRIAKYAVILVLVVVVIAASIGISNLGPEYFPVSGPF
jgi:hypothetical protein